MQNNTEVITSGIKASNRLLLRADAYCLYDETCPFHSQGKGAVIEVSFLVTCIAQMFHLLPFTRHGIQ